MIGALAAMFAAITAVFSTLPAILGAAASIVGSGMTHKAQRDHARHVAMQREAFERERNANLPRVDRKTTIPEVKR